jgi:hypothetical protein
MPQASVRARRCGWGFAAASNSHVFVQDADLEYDPAIFATRSSHYSTDARTWYPGSASSADRTAYYFFWHCVGNRFITVLSNAVSDLNLSDMETGMKAFVRQKLMELRLLADRFAFEPEITAKAARARRRIYEVGISY